jgi:hypothetical protein
MVIHSKPIMEQIEDLAVEKLEWFHVPKAVVLGKKQYEQLAKELRPYGNHLEPKIKSNMNVRFASVEDDTDEVLTSESSVVLVPKVRSVSTVGGDIIVIPISLDDYIEVISDEDMDTKI